MFSKTSKCQYKTENDYESRVQESQRILSKYPDRVPVICEKHSMSETVPSIDKSRFLVPGELTVGQFIYVVRKRLSLSSDKAIFLFTSNNTLPPTSKLMSSLFVDFKDEDGFLYLFFSGESVFG
jgi:GABA(A) receptor-associated protein